MVNRDGSLSSGEFNPPVGDLAESETPLRGEDDFIGHLYEATVRPERFDALIKQWDARLAGSGDDLEVRLADMRSQPFLRHVERAIDILDGLNVFEFQELDVHLAAVPCPAIVFAPSGAVVASNTAARTAHALFPGGSVRSLKLEPEDLHALAQSLERIASRSVGQGEVLRCRPIEGRRDIHVYLRPIEGGRNLRPVLMVSSELPWTGALGSALERAFGLTEAEIAVVRRLFAGETVAEIAHDTDRRESTIRSQIHTILAKTGTQTQAEVLRLAGLLQASLALEPGRSARAHPGALVDPPSRQVRLPDGRRMSVLRFGDPHGRTVLWLQSQLGFFTPTRSGEADLRRAGIRVVVPIRAGYGPSDPPPSDRDVLEVAVDDLVAVMETLGLARVPVVALVDDMWIALSLARRDASRVSHVLGIGAGFPITRPEHYRQLHPVGRFFRACARHAPQLLPFLIRLIRARMIRSCLDNHARPNMRSPADLAALDDPEIFDAWMAGFTYLYGPRQGSEAALCAELRRFHEDWPQELGDVTCPVTLLHGRQDGNNPYDTAQAMAESYPRWRFLGRDDAGQLALYSCWEEILALLCRMAEDQKPSTKELPPS